MSEEYILLKEKLLSPFLSAVVCPVWDLSLNGANTSFHAPCEPSPEKAEDFSNGVYFRNLEGTRILVATSRAKVRVLRQKSSHGRKWETLSSGDP